MTGVTGAIGLGLGLAGAAAIGLSGIGVVVAPAILVAGGATGGGLGVKVYRTAYRYAMRRGHRALDRLLGAVGSRAEGGWGITKLGDH